MQGRSARLPPGLLSLHVRRFTAGLSARGDAHSPPVRRRPLVRADSNEVV
jgi:hypothetical protein